MTSALHGETKTASQEPVILGGYNRFHLLTTVTLTERVAASSCSRARW
jgi:hypothetical protein